MWSYWLIMWSDTSSISEKIHNLNRNYQFMCGDCHKVYSDCNSIPGDCQNVWWDNNWCDRYILTLGVNPSIFMNYHYTARSFYIDSILKRIYCEFTQNDEYNSRRRDKYMDPPYRVLVDRMENWAVVWVYWRNEWYED